MKLLADYVVEEKASSLHIVKGSAFLGVHFLKDVLRLNIVLKRAIETDLPYKLDKPSKDVFHNRIDLSEPDDFDETISEYIREAYELKV